MTASWPGRLARQAYSAALGLIEPLYVLRLWWRGKAEPLYRHAIAERFGRYAGARSQGWLWVHAVSLGETRAAAALVDAMRAADPGLRLLLTHGTATGREAGADLLRAGDHQTWLPYDTPAVVKRFIRQFRPAVGVLMETEIWPNLLHAADEAGVPMVLANARLSPKSFAQGQRLKLVMEPAAKTFALVLAQTDADAERLRASGAPKVFSIGNLKFDMTPPEALLARGRAWRAASDRPIVLAASTREGEEAMLLAAWRALPESRPRLLIVPRHPQRFDAAGALIEQAGFSVSRRSGWGDAPGPSAWAAEVWLGDSMGEMPLYYASADVALLGGSFAPLGGQNLIEAAACGCPIVMGPHTYNFADAAERSLAAGAALRVVDMNQGVAQAVTVASEPASPMRERALAFAAAHRGAAARMAQAVLGVMRDATARR